MVLDPLGRLDRYHILSANLRAFNTTRDRRYRFAMHNLPFLGFPTRITNPMIQCRTASRDGDAI